MLHNLCIMCKVSYVHFYVISVKRMSLLLHEIISIVKNRVQKKLRKNLSFFIMEADNLAYDEIPSKLATFILELFLSER